MVDHHLSGPLVLLGHWLVGQGPAFSGTPEGIILNYSHILTILSIIAHFVAALILVVRSGAHGDRSLPRKLSAKLSNSLECMCWQFFYTMHMMVI